MVDGSSVSRKRSDVFCIGNGRICRKSVLSTTMVMTTMTKKGNIGRRGTSFLDQRLIMVTDGKRD